MNSARYERLAARLDVFAGEKPRAYRFNVFALSLIGYAYIFFILGLLALIFLALLALAVQGKGLAIVFKLGLAIIILSWTIVRSLFARVSPPEGIQITKADAPELFRTIDELRLKLKTPRIHRVLIDREFNASVSQIPLIGFVWNRNYLNLGLPYMMGSTQGQFTATLAHELGHISRAHGRFGYWVFRAQRTWNILLGTLEASERWGAILFRFFFRWYAPYFEAYALAASRQHEYEADALAAQVASAQDNGDDLLNIVVRGYMFDKEFWSALSKRAADETEPPYPYHELQQYLKDAPDPSTAQWLIDNAMKHKVDSTSTHPTISQRLDAMGVEAVLPEAFDESASEHFLLPITVTKLADFYSSQWREVAQQSWKEMGDEQRENLNRIEFLTSIDDVGEAGIDHLMELASRQEDIDNLQSSVNALRGAIKLQPDHADAQYQLGRILLGGLHQEGIAHLENAMDIDPGCSVMALERICTFMESEGMQEESVPYYKRLELQRKLLEEFEEEGNTLAVDDDLVKPTIDSFEMEIMQAELGEVEGLLEAHISLKRSSVIEGNNYYVVGLLPKRGSVNKHNTLLDHIAMEVSFPFECKLFMLNYHNRKTRKAFLDASVTIIKK